VLIGAPPPDVSLLDGAGDGTAGHVPGEPQADIARLADALRRIPNDDGAPDWEAWNRIGMALWAATGGSREGLKLWLAFSSRHPSYNEKEARARWRNYRRSPPASLGAGTLFHAADQADQVRLGDFLDLGMSDVPQDELPGGEPEPEAPPEEPPESPQANGEDAEGLDGLSPEERAKWRKAAQPPPSEPPGTELVPLLPPLPPEPEWPEPIGQEAYRGLLGEIVDATMPTTEGDANAILLQHLIFLGNAIGIGPNTPWCWGGKVVHRTNLTTIALGETAYARKGTATAEPMFLYRQINPAWSRHHIRSGLHSGEGLIYAVRDELTRIDPQNPLGPPIVVHTESDTKNILVIETEFSVPLTRMQVPGNTLGDLLKQCWDGGLLETLTRHTPVRATGHLVSLIAHDTFASFRLKLPLVSTQDGFANRALLTCVRRSKLLSDPPTLPPDVVDGFVQGIDACLQAARTRGEMRRSAQAKPLWDELYRRLNAPTPGLYGAITSRGHVQVLRLAMLFALFAQRGTIEDEDLHAAMAVWRFCAASAFYLFGEQQTDPFADRVLGALRHAGPRGLTRSDLYDAFKRHTDKDVLDKALATLARNGHAYREARPTAGRTAEVWFYIKRRYS
jgi:hypothetical protein